MAEETGANEKKSNVHKQNIKSSDNGWIICRSQKRPGLFYDFNTFTGEAVWRDPDKIETHHSTVDQNRNLVGSHVPREPPLDPADYNTQNVTQADTIPNILNKQMINNQFPKPFTISPFGNIDLPCPQYSLLNSNNNIGMNGALPSFWAPPQVLISPAVPPLNQSIFGGLQNVQFQNTPVPLSNRFQVLNQLNNNRPAHLLEERKGNKSYHPPPRNNWNIVKNHQNKPNDLRNILSSRKRQDLQNSSQISQDGPDTSKDIPASVAEGEVIPDDTDKWLEAHTDSEGKKLKLDMECIWKLANSSANRDCWYIVTGTRVLLNNIRFLSSLVNTDERLRLLAPRDVVRGLRRATFSDKGSLADCAKRLLFAIRQTSKLPDTKPDKLIEQNNHLVFLIDEKDNQDNIIDQDDVLKFTVTELKHYLVQNTKANTVSKIQKMCEKITIIVPNNEAQPESLSVVNTTTSPSSQDGPSIGTEKTHVEIKSSTTIKEIEIQTDLTTSTGKRTANASVQTDFEFPLTQTVEISPTQEMKIGHTVDAVIASKVAPRKIRLKRQHQSPNTVSDSDEKKTFKWRKRKDEKNSLTSNLISSQYENCYHSSPYESLPTSISTNDLTQQNDNAVDVDCGFSDISVTANMIDETSTSGVISNSIDSESMFKVSKQAILNESKAEHKVDIVMYEVTSDFMREHLSTRRDEWVSRFVQIMEEVLNEVLQLEPPFNDSTLPPPWTILEATACIKRKLKLHSSIVDASDRLAVYFFKISDKRGNIKTDISPSEFMQMFSFAVNLINALQMVLKNCEDIQIALKSLFKLLSDIREPNLEESDEETFDNDDHSANISMTNLSTAADVPDVNVPASDDSPKSSRIQIEKKKEEEKAEILCNGNDDPEYSLFSSLGLKKNTFKVNNSIVKTVLNDHQNGPSFTLPSEQTKDITPDHMQAFNENDNFKPGEPKIIRNFRRCPEIEKKLNSINSAHAEFDHENAHDDYVTEYGGIAENVDFTEDVHVGNKFYDNENNYGGIIQTSIMDIDQICESTKSGDLDANSIFKWIVQRTTYDYDRCLVKLRRFCEATHEELKSINYWEPEYKTHVTEKTREASARAKNVCNRLRCILNREPIVTKTKFCDVFNVFGIHEYVMEDSQLKEYQVMIEKYLKHADLLLTFVTILADHIKEK